MTATQSSVKQRFIAVGANRIPNASDWDVNSGLIAYGAGKEIAIWRVDETDTLRSGVVATLKGHTDKVNTVRFLEKLPSSIFGHPGASILVSGSVDKTIRVWLRRQGTAEEDEPRYDLLGTGQGLEGSVVDVAFERLVSSPDDSSNGPEETIMASAASDGTVKIWRFCIPPTLANPASDEGEPVLRCIQTITTKPKYFPLSLAISRLSASSNSYALAICGSSTAFQVFVSDGPTATEGNFKHAATLTGHENWVRSLAFVREPHKSGVEEGVEEDLLLASASQDKYIRLWRIHHGSALPTQSVGSSTMIMGQALSNKAHLFEADGKPYSITFEALLLGHEDWVYNVSWYRSKDTSDPDAVAEGREKITLLSSSADNSLSIWEADEASGIWVCMSRLGEASGQKGSSTATGSTGGFWTGLWSPEGTSVVSFGKSGGWRRWSYDEKIGAWEQNVAATGHVREVMGISWEKSGSYLLSTSLDQSTRLYARWKSSKHRSWFEFSRPQIHGYDINSIVSLTSTKFVSGADEKLLRVFGQPRGIAKILDDLCDIKPEDIDALPDVASQPVLGLSNKAVTGTPAAAQNGDSEAPEDDEADASQEVPANTPPFEDSLSRHTLWPEDEKLYGHGYEISAAAATNAGDIVATACKASSTTHGVIRLFETTKWRQLKPPLEAHSLTVHRIAFSGDDKYMLSVGRDRAWAVFERTSGKAVGEDLETPYRLAQIMSKAHTRAIYDGKWLPASVGGSTGWSGFVTAARDKTVKSWGLKAGLEDGKKEWICEETVKFGDEPVTAVDVVDRVVKVGGEDVVVLGVALESGSVMVYKAGLKEEGTGVKSWEKWVQFDDYVVPGATITQLAWKPTTGIEVLNHLELAIASEDSSVRIYEVSLE